MRQIYRILVAEVDGERFDSPKLITERNINDYRLALLVGRAKLLYSIRVTLPDQSGAINPVTSGLERFPL